MFLNLKSPFSWTQLQPSVSIGNLCSWCVPKVNSAAPVYPGIWEEYLCLFIVDHLFPSAHSHPFTPTTARSHCGLLAIALMSPSEDIKVSAKHKRDFTGKDWYLSMTFCAFIALGKMYFFLVLFSLWLCSVWDTEGEYRKVNKWRICLCCVMQAVIPHFLNLLPIALLLSIPAFCAYFSQPSLTKTEV